MVVTQGIEGLQLHFEGKVGQSPLDIKSFKVFCGFRYPRTFMDALEKARSQEYPVNEPISNWFGLTDGVWGYTRVVPDKIPYPVEIEVCFPGPERESFPWLMNFLLRDQEAELLIREINEFMTI